MDDAAQKLFSRRSFFVALAMLMGFGLVLWLEGRPGWCKYGIGFYSPAWTHCTSQHFLDPYSLSHLLHGVIFYWMLRPLAHIWSLAWRLVAALVLEIGWELIENSSWVIEHYRQHTASLDYIGDSVLNSISDVLMIVIGFYFASKVSWKWAVVVFIAFELWAIYLARDNLTFNVLMFFVPLEGVKGWQMQGM
jgi:hypothetical protein